MFILWIKFANASTTVSCEALKLSPILRNLILKFDRLVQEISVYCPQIVGFVLKCLLMAKSIQQ